MTSLPKEAMMVSDYLNTQDNIIIITSVIKKDSNPIEVSKDLTVVSDIQYPHFSWNNNNNTTYTVRDGNMS